MKSPFVVADAMGREIDAHIIDFGIVGAIIQIHSQPWPFPDAISEQGRIAGVNVTCVSKETQLAM